MNGKIVSIDELRRRAAARSRLAGKEESPASGPDETRPPAVSAEEDTADPSSAPERDRKSRPASPAHPLGPAELEQLAADLRAELGDLPDVRADKVIEAKLRISQGYYTGERIADGLLESWLGPDPEGPGTPAGPPESPEETAESAAGDTSYEERT